MRTMKTIVALALTASALLSVPAFAAENPPSPTPQVTKSEPAKEPAKDPAKEPAKPAAPQPLQIKVGDASLRFGLLVQPQAEFAQGTTGAYTQNLQLRRIRFLIGGQATKTVFFFFETENSRLGSATTAGAKTVNSGFQTLDAAVEWRANKKFNLAGGLIRVPTARDALESASSEFTIDFNTYAFMTSTALNGTAGRDTGVQLRGYFLDDRLEYRAAVVSGMRENGNRNSFRKVGRLQYNFFDKEVYAFPSYAGSNFGAKKIVAFGAAADSQVDYFGWNADLFADVPTRFGSSVSTLTYQDVDGGGKRSPNGLAEQHILTADTGVYSKTIKAATWVRYEQRSFIVQKTRDEKRYALGVNYYPMGNNVNVKFAVSRFKPVTSPRWMSQFTAQLQVFYY